MTMMMIMTLMMGMMMMMMSGSAIQWTGWAGFAKAGSVLREGGQVGRPRKSVDWVWPHHSYVQQKSLGKIIGILEHHGNFLQGHLSGHIATLSNQVKRDTDLNALHGLVHTTWPCCYHIN